MVPSFIQELFIYQPHTLESEVSQWDYWVAKVDVKFMCDLWNNEREREQEGIGKLLKANVLTEVTAGILTAKKEIESYDSKCLKNILVWNQLKLG